MTALAPELVPDTARVCALLARRPTTVYLIARILALPRESVEPVIWMLWTRGALQVCGERHAMSAANDEAAMEVPSPSSTLWSRLWLKLTA